MQLIPNRTLRCAVIYANKKGNGEEKKEEEEERDEIRGGKDHSKIRTQEVRFYTDGVMHHS